MPQVILEGVSKVFSGGIQAVREVSFTIEDQEFFVLLGPSGCGKTTTLRLIAGLEEPTSGQLSIGNQPMNGVAPHLRGVGMLFQTPALYPHLTVRQNLAFTTSLRYNFFGRSRRKPSEEAAKRIEQVAEWLHLGPFLDRLPRQLSGGERQRVVLGRALVRRPAVLLLDEPLAHLDPQLRGEIRSEFKRLRRDLGLTILWVTHDHAEALALADRLAVMRAGQLGQVDTPWAVYHEPRNVYVARQVGYPPMNLLPGRLSQDSRQLVFRSGTVAAVCSAGQPGNTEWLGRELQLGIRAEDVWLSEDCEPDSLRMRIEDHEYIDGQVLVTLGRDGMHLVARCPESRQWQRGKEIAVSWNWERVHWFDAASGQRLPALRTAPAG